MSDITNIVLLTSIAEGVETDTELDACPGVDQINAWLIGRFAGQLADVGHAAGGGKAMEALAFAGAFSRLDVDAFLAFVKSVDWIEPSSIQVLVKRDADEVFTLKTI